jgi:hypothetical protein
MSAIDTAHITALGAIAYRAIDAVRAEFVIAIRAVLQP